MYLESSTMSKPECSTTNIWICKFYKFSNSFLYSYSKSKYSSKQDQDVLMTLTHISCQLNKYLLTGGNHDYKWYCFMTLGIYLHIHWWHFLTCLCEFSFTYRLLICIFQEFHSFAKNTPNQKFSYCCQPCKKSLSVAT